MHTRFPITLVVFYKDLHEFHFIVGVGAAVAAVTVAVVLTKYCDCDDAKTVKHFHKICDISSVKSFPLGVFP